jgi:hypothetical protein
VKTDLRCARCNRPISEDEAHAEVTIEGRTYSVCALCAPMFGVVEKARVREDEHPLTKKRRVGRPAKA